ncbi:hypothetical protein NYE54_05550 [Paenibacillus sp. FSL K6-1330]|uniref:hypothetical protein n=1 Tax=Paenibacillus sp. FSL K6-1330 TaxID=2975292 RepID=UPI0030DC084D
MALERYLITKHGLNLVARYQTKDVPKLEKMIVVGADAESEAAEDIKQWNNSGNSAKLMFLHRDMSGRFAMTLHSRIWQNRRISRQRNLPLSGLNIVPPTT